MKTNSKFLHLSMAARNHQGPSHVCGALPDAPGSEPGRMISCGSTKNWRLAANAGKLGSKDASKSIGVSKNRGKTPKMDAENNGKPY